MTITVAECTTGYKGFANVFLVRGYGKRAIKVVVRPGFAARHVGYLEYEELAKRGAEKAAKYGWRLAVVAPDDYYQEDARLFNWHQFSVENHTLGHQGKFLYNLGDGAFGGFNND